MPPRTSSIWSVSWSSCWPLSTIWDAWNGSEKSLPRRSRPIRRERTRELAWMRLRGIERLPARARHIAAGLSRWRENEARQRNLPRTFVLRDETLLELARKGPVEATEIRRLRGFQSRRHGRFAEAIALEAQRLDALFESAAGAARDAPARRFAGARPRRVRSGRGP